MGFELLLPLRIAQTFFAIIVLGLSAYVAHWYDADTLTQSPPQIDFLIFASIFTVASVAYLEITPRVLPKLSHPFVHFTLEILNTLFYFGGFIAMSAFLGKLLFCRGSVCAAARADAVISAFSFIGWVGSTTILAMELFKGGFSAAKTDARAKNAMKETTMAPKV